jgi:hypothetical protein
MATATCHTDGCGNADAPIEIQNTWTDDETGETQQIPVVCGVCGNVIEDVT